MTDLDTFFMILSSEYNIKLYRRDSIIIFDEVQQFPKARQAVKYLVADGRYDYIETGSLISIKEKVKGISQYRSGIISIFASDFSIPFEIGTPGDDEPNRKGGDFS